MKRCKVPMVVITAPLLALAARAFAAQPGVEANPAAARTRSAVTCPCTVEGAEAPVSVDVRGPRGTFTIRPARIIKNSSCHMAPGGLTCFAGGEECEWVRVEGVWIC